MSELQLLIVGSIVLLTILSTIIALQVSLIFRDLKRVIDKMDKVLQNMQVVSSMGREYYPPTNGQKETKHDAGGKTLKTLPKRSSSFPTPLGKRFFKRKGA